MSHEQCDISCFCDSNQFTSNTKRWLVIKFFKLGIIKYIRYHIIFSFVYFIRLVIKDFLYGFSTDVNKLLRILMG